MLVSGLVLTLEPTPTLPALLARLAADPRLELAPMIGDRLPLAAEVTDPAEGRRLLDELAALPGVRLVHVARVDFDGEER